MTDFLNEVGTTEVARDSLKMEVNKPASWSAQDLRTRPVIPSGPAAFLMFTLLSSLRTSSSDTVITWLSLLCLLLPDALIGRVAPPLHSKRPKKVFNSSANNGSALTSAEGLFPEEQMVFSPCHMRRESLSWKCDSILSLYRSLAALTARRRA